MSSEAKTGVPDIRRKQARSDRPGMAVGWLRDSAYPDGTPIDLLGA